MVLGTSITGAVDVSEKVAGERCADSELPWRRVYY